MRSKNDETGRGSILILDDDLSTRQTLTALMEGEGFAVRCAPNGQTALMSAREEPPDLVLLDVRLPDVDGFEVCRRLKENADPARSGRRPRPAFAIGSASRPRGTCARSASVGGFSAIAPIFPQQSIREMTRTGRSPIEVMDDATWGMFAEGWRDGTGADADHLKTTADIDACLAASFSMFTIDPGDHVDSSADTAGLPTLRAQVEALPWAELADTEESLRKRFLGQSFAVEHLKVAFDEAVLLRAAAKYGKAVAHVARTWAFPGWRLA